MESGISINNLERDYRSPKIHINKTLNESTEKKLHKPAFSNDIYYNRLLKKLSNPLPKITHAINLKKHSPNLKTANNFDFITNNKIKIKQTRNKNKISHTENSPHKTKNTKKLSQSTQTLKVKNAIKLDKLYGFDKTFYRSKKHLKKRRTCNECLENYQKKILKISGRTLSRDNLMKLYTELKEIKNVAEMSKPLPPMNFPALVLHSINEKKNNFTKGKWENENKNFSDMDDFEKEMYNIKKGKGFKKNKILLNKGMYKIYEILPEYVVDALYNQKF